VTETVVEPRLVTVTPMQRKVIGELAYDGADNATIALRLHLSEHTVKTHLKRAQAAIGADNRTHLVCLLLRKHVQLRVEDNRSNPPRPEEPA
jgi:DNA-binding CsgD family transcriptional regulator